ncbi:tetraspanin-6-like [Anolis sagrei]|uniref:tetraspanin-6-like n=1 Tax=Anolis sagrei TaxID=38937 RepID=UPI00351F8E3D
MLGKEVTNWETVVKICLWLTVLLYWISGVVLICIGVSIQVKLRDIFAVLNEGASVVPVVITIVGTFIIIISAFGAIAVLKRNSKMIKIFAGILLAHLITGIIAGAVAYTYREKLHQTLLKDVLETMDKYSEELQITKGVDSLQSQFQCCGAENYTDWLNTTFGSLSSSVPRSCCKVPVESCVTDLSQYPVGINQQGCVAKVKTWFGEHIVVIGGIRIFIGLVQLTGIVFCYLLLKILNENYESVE